MEWVPAGTGARLQEDGTRFLQQQGPEAAAVAALRLSLSQRGLRKRKDIILILGELMALLPPQLGLCPALFASGGWRDKHSSFDRPAGPAGNGICRLISICGAGEQMGQNWLESPGPLSMT